MNNTGVEAETHPCHVLIAMQIVCVYVCEFAGPCLCWCTVCVGVSDCMCEYMCMCVLVGWLERDKGAHMA